MKNVSVEFEQELNNDNRRYIKVCNITLTDGTVLSIDNSQIWPDSFKHDDAVSNTNNFDIGSAIIGKFSIVLNNIYDDFSDYDFTDAVVSNVKIGLELPNGTVEYVRKGVFTVDETSYNGSLITLECLDNMHKFDRPYSESKLIYPATLGAIVRDACSCCGVSLAADSAAFENDDYVVDARPDDGTLTFRNVLLWVGQISCHWCRCNINGELSLGWYDTGLLDKIISSFDGGTFAFEDWDTTLDGGTMNPWSTGDTEVDGGSFKRNAYHDIHFLASMSICTDDVVITGIKVVEKTDSDKDSTTLYGSEGYILSIEGNELIQNGKGAEVAEYLGIKLIGLQFRPLSVSCLSDPSMEAGDVAVVTDRKGNRYTTLVTSTTFTAGNYQQVSCDAETPIRKSADRFSEATRVYKELRSQLSRQKSEWEKAIENLGNSLGVTSGLYSTIEKQEGGSKIFYLHDKELLEESKVIWKMTSDAWGVSTDGGKTWNGGMTVDGTVIARILNTIGINADWINTGTFIVKDQDGNIIFLADCDTGRVEIHPDVFSLSEEKITDIVNSAIRKKTNLLKDTVEFTSDYWSTAGTVFTGYEDPDGGTDAVRIFRRKAGTNAYLPSYLNTKSTNNPIRVTEQVYAFSVWLKASADTTAKLSLGDVEDTVNVTTEWKRYDLSLNVGGELPTASGQVKIEFMGTVDTEDNIIYLYIYDPTVTYGTQEKEYTQEEIFNILTNNGASKGISLVDGQLYISFSIAQGDVLKLGGANNDNGKLVILDKDNNQVGYIDNTGVHFNQGEFSGKITAKEGIIGGFHISSSSDTSAYTGHAYTNSLYRHSGDGTYEYEVGIKGDGAAATSNSDGSGAGNLAFYITRILKGKTWVSANRTNIFYVTHAGKLYCVNADIEGKITAISGKVGGFIVDSNQIYTDPSMNNVGSLLLSASSNGSYIRFRHKENERYVTDFDWSFNGIASGYTSNALNLMKRPALSSDTFSDGTHHNLGSTYFYGDVKSNGDFEVASGYTKAVQRDTENYGIQNFYCYETPTPSLGDFGESVIDSDGFCIVDIDDIFRESVNTKIKYYVFLQKEGRGDCWVSEKKETYFVVEGTPDLKFSYEIKAKQRELEHIRFSDPSRDNNVGFLELDYEAILNNERECIIGKMEEIDYEEIDEFYEP